MQRLSVTASSTASRKSGAVFCLTLRPARCAELLAEGRADAALIPVIEYQRIPGLKVAQGACVASKSKVQSVVLASRVPVAEVRSVALDTSSRTSAALIQIILGRFYGLSPQYQTSPPHIEEMLESNDAALIIGDPAMLIDRSRLRCSRSGRRVAQAHGIAVRVRVLGCPKRFDPAVK